MTRTTGVEGLVWIGGGGLMVYSALQLPLGDPRRAFNLPGPGWFPLVLGGALAVLGVLLLVKAALERRRAADTASPQLAVGRAGFWIDRKTGSVVASLVAYAVLFEPLGFLLATLLFLALVIGGFSSYTWRTSLAVAAGVSLGAWLVFDVWLRAQLPRGLLLP